jgi:CheY-like chemotaxis protein/glycine cleavage system H lipoate-binding protein
MSTERDILVVEDEPMVTQAVVLVCKDAGMTVSAVDSAAEALRLLRTTRFRLVLCDIMMQELDGFGFLQQVDLGGIDTPVVMMTGYSTVENAIRSLAAGAVDYIPKPFTTDELLAVIRRSLRSSALLTATESAQLEGTSRLSFVPCPDDYLRLGYVSWVLMEDEGTARVGVTDLFLKAIDGISGIELGEPGENLVQGVPGAEAIATDGMTHGIMCPMSGKVLEVNEDARSKPSLIEKDPYFKGWLYRILPSDPESNLQWLSL